MSETHNVHNFVDLVDDIPDPLDIAEIFRKRRKELKMTQEELARIAGVSRATVNRFENANFGDIGFSVVLRMAVALGLTFKVEKSIIASYREGGLHYQDKSDPRVAGRLRRARRAIKKVQELERERGSFAANMMLYNGDLSRILNEEELRGDEDEEEFEDPSP